jgi:hypothetical protein
MFETLSQAMRLYPTVQLTALPRMADFCQWGYVVAEALGGQGDDFLAAYLEAIGAQTSAAIENHPVATAVLAFLGGPEAVAAQPGNALLWEGTAAELLTALEQVATDHKIDMKARLWPKASNALMRRLNEVRSNLLDFGIQASSEPKGTHRQVTFRKVTENTVNIVNIVPGTGKQCVAADDVPHDIALLRADSVSPLEEMLTLWGSTDDIGAVSDATVAHLLSEAKAQLHNEFGEPGSASDDTDDIFGTLAQGSVTVGATQDGPLPEYITTSAQLDAVLPALCAAPLLAVDTETTGLDPLTAHVRLIQFALPDRVIVVDAGQVPVQRLVPVFTVSHLLAFHNAKFDLKFLRTDGLSWPISSVFDTMLAAQLLGAGTVDGQLKQCGLAAVAQRYLSFSFS